MSTLSSDKNDVLSSNTPAIVTCGEFEVRESIMTPQKMVVLWGMLQRHKTLFSDLTRGDFANWEAFVRDPSTYWLEVYKDGEFVGIVNFAEMYQKVDIIAHMVFFDRMPHEKVDVCRAIIRYMFTNFPVHRITVTPPYMYYALIRLLGKLGFTQEGRKREAMLLGGKWVDQLIFGITRGEVL